ncbi:MAG: hypothetical protein HYV51_02415 [Parcubacteria group bacterium]|nr:hypothetical protein [Parcubacteria group bacterium]
MAEKQVMSSTLVLQTDREKLIEKLQNMQSNNLTEKQQKRMMKYRKLFVELNYCFFGLSEYQLKAFSAKEWKVLDELISRKAWPWAIGQMLFTFGIPLVGWIIGPSTGLNNEGMFKSWIYIRHRKYFKKIYGKDLSPLFESLK